MFIDNRLTEADMVRAHRQPSNAPMLLAGSFYSQIQAMDIFTTEAVLPAISSLTTRTDRQTAFIGIFFRMAGFAKAALALNATLYQQALTSAERSMWELYVDSALIHLDAFSDGVERIWLWSDWQRLKAARRVEAFVAANPKCTDLAEEASARMEFIRNNEARIVADVRRVFGVDSRERTVRPEHWTALTLPERVDLLPTDIACSVIKGYDMRNFAVHTGLTGVMNFSKEHFQIMCMRSLEGIATAMHGELLIIGQELDLPSRIPGYDDVVGVLEKVRVFAYADKQLQALGNAPRYFVQPGEPPADAIASGTVEKLWPQP